MRTIIIAMLVLFAGHSFGQSVVFDYDASGNRISRVIVMGTKAAAIADSTGTEAIPEQQIEYTDRLAETEITIYPNPTQGRLAVKIANIPQEYSASLALFDINRREILRKEPFGNFNELDISSQPFGTYIMRITVGTETTTWKIIKN